MWVAAGYIARVALPYLIAIAVFVGGAWWLWAAGGNHVRELKDAEIAQMQGQHMLDLKAIDDAHQLALEAERKRSDEQLSKARADMVAMDVKYTKEMSDAKSKHEADVAAVRAGTLRVRERFTCQGGSDARTSGAAAAAGRPSSMGDAGQAGGLQGADVEFLLSEASRADDVARQLMACQAIVKRDRVE